jgi:hypothetical protein
MKRDAPWLRTGRNYRPTPKTVDLDRLWLMLVFTTAEVADIIRAEEEQQAPSPPPDPEPEPDPLGDPDQAVFGPAMPPWMVFNRGALMHLNNPGHQRQEEGLDSES